MTIGKKRLTREEKFFKKKIAYVWKLLNQRQRARVRKFIRNGRFNQAGRTTCLIGIAFPRGIFSRIFLGNPIKLGDFLRANPLANDVFDGRINSHDTDLERAGEMIIDFVRRQRK